ncbi:MAG: EamA family transporter [Actinomycetota bacterium]|nr:EamA family transporter [Actinomycetota bacterium]
MTAALGLAVAAALLLGASDFFAARSARTTPAITVTRTAVGTSVVFSPLLLLLVDSQWIGRDLIIGSLSGLAMITGLMLLYRGYAVARMGIVAPLSSVLLATVPVVWDLINGVTPSALAAFGMALGVAALVLTSYTPGGAGSVTQGAVLGLGSGLAFGVAFTLMGEVSRASGLTPVITQRGTGFVLLAVIGLVRRDPFFAEGIGRQRAAVAGLLGLVAIGSLQVAFQRGDLGPVSVASSQFATVAVILSVLFNHERMRWWQAVGVGTTALAVALIAAGG